ncbi:MAG: tRNA pseudouridine(38-40) synthase TruA, partial [Rhodopirellula bahusiensis]
MPANDRPRTFHLTVAYDGTEYCGWQVQPEQRSIQSELERVIRPLAGSPVR